MKKLFFAFALSFACVVAFAQESWTHMAGLSFSAPFYSMEVKGDGTKNIFSPQGTARYFGAAPNGFCISGTFGMGPAFSKNFSLGDDSLSSTGLSLSFSAGAGYAFGITDRFTLAALGSLSLDWMRYKFKKEIKAATSYGSLSTEWTQSDNLLAFGIGAELLGFYSLTDRISLFASFAFRFFDAGRLWREGKNEGRSYDATYDLRGNFSITPSIGATWTF
ncbi:MAG: hypothetical protein K6A42_02230 [Treponema sp.]|nr:hypothetical protein [Treponema sp.]